MRAVASTIPLVITPERTMNTRLVLVAVVSVALLAACGKASEKVTEKVIESQIEKDGSKAKVDLSGGSMKVTTTDAAGKVSQVEIGGAKVSETDVGVPFYPGSQPRDGESSKVSSADGAMATVTLHSGDAAEKVAAFYRDKLKAQAEGKQFTDMNTGDTQMLMLTDEKTKQMTQVMIGKGEGSGSTIHIVANRGSAK
jgi:hypothetical protein